jgi:hypothetical protein
VAESDSNGTEPQPLRITTGAIQEPKDNLTPVAEKLERRMKDLTGRLEIESKDGIASEEELSDVASLREEWNVTRQYLEVCTQADMHIKEHVSNIEDYITASTVNFRVSIGGEPIRFNL